jgi:mannose-1-phosphate guanylyltransferase
MEAVILAAGLGTRLRPLTENKPKALIPVANRPIISRNIDYLKFSGVQKIMVNAHHHYQQLVDYLDERRSFGIQIDVRVEPQILGTGGGIRNCVDLSHNGTFIVMNGDILTNIDLAKALDHHKKAGHIATLVLHYREPYNSVLIDNMYQIIEIGLQNKPAGLAFTGIHILEPEVLQNIPVRGYSDIIDCYNGMIDAGESIGAYISENHYWHDIGTPEAYISANRDILARNNTPFAIGPSSVLDPSARLEDWAVIGEASCLEKGVRIGRSILWDNVTVRADKRVQDSILTSGNIVETDLINEVL